MLSPGPIEGLRLRDLSCFLEMIPAMPQAFLDACASLLDASQGIRNLLARSEPFARRRFRPWIWDCCSRIWDWRSVLVVAALWDLEIGGRGRGICGWQGGICARGAWESRSGLSDRRSLPQCSGLGFQTQLQAWGYPSSQARLISFWLRAGSALMPIPAWYITARL